MDRETYLQLIQNSEAFKALEKELQDRILHAEGEEMEKFAAIFQEEFELIFAAKKTLVEKNEQVLKALGTDMKKFVHEYFQKEESLQREQETQGAENLIKTL